MEVDVEFKYYVIKSHPIGSRYVCDPPVMDTDKDTLILVTDLGAAAGWLLQNGWTACHNGEYVDTYFLAFRKGEDNYVLTKDEKFFNRYGMAAEVAKALNLTSKEDRIKVHTACLNASLGYYGLISWDSDQILMS